MPFKVVDAYTAAAKPGDILLVKDRWNDWFTWITQFLAVVILDDGRRYDIGNVKIARAGMHPKDAITNLPSEFSSLGDGWFSIGQGENYYQTLETLGPPYRSWFLEALQDCAYDLERLARYNGEAVLRESLLRDIEEERVRNRFHRLAHGNAALTPFAFKYTLPVDPVSMDPPPALTFKVTPGSQPPSNIHVIIGRNGVGKTRCFDLLARNFIGRAAMDGTSSGELKSLSVFDSTHGFAGLVTVSFSPFDEYGPLIPEQTPLTVRYSYVGLIQEVAPDLISGPPREAQSSLTIKGRKELTEDFVKSVGMCRAGARRERWEQALKTLEADPLFEEANISAIADETLEDWQPVARKLFKRLSSGHSVVILTISRLVELVEERSLVLIDEPEGHLHPPLLSALVRALSDLLISRNGVAIIATHSPVVLQEVPSDCIWVLGRSGHSSRADRPEIETFGENVGILTREVFGLEVVRTGFHRMISDAAEGKSYADVIGAFGDRLGAEARGLARIMTLPSPEDFDFGDIE